MAAISSRRFEDLKDELISLKENIRIHLRRNANNLTINKLIFDGDHLIETIRNEVTKCPASVQSEMNIRFYSLKNEWTAFKSTIDRSSLIGSGFRRGEGFEGPSSGYSGPSATQRQILAQGIETLEQTSKSLHRAEAVAKEAEDIGTNIIDELGNQRESLLRARGMLDENAANLKRSHRLIRAINTQLITNKCLLILIIVMEIVILIAIVMFRFILVKHH